MRILYNLFFLTIVSSSMAQVEIKVDISTQKMYVLKSNIEIKQYNISTSKYGIGGEINSNKTPLGKHIIKKKIGEGVVSGTRFVSRVNTNQISKVYKDRTKSKTDDVLTRIMWLSGLEKGKNEHSFKRYIYIHGTSEEGFIGEPASHGCIRMTNKDVIELFDLIQEGTLVYIEE